MCQIASLRFESNQIDRHDSMNVCDCVSMNESKKQNKAKTKYKKISAKVENKSNEDDDKKSIEQMLKLTRVQTLEEKKIRAILCHVVTSALLFHLGEEKKSVTCKTFYMQRSIKPDH